MTRTRYKIYEDGFPYFITCTINGWLPIFTQQEAVDIIFESWRYLQRERKFELYAYVILENHLHLVASSPDLSAVIQSFKSYTAKEIITLLKKRQAYTLLQMFATLKRQHKTQSEYQVWEESGKPKQIQNDEMMRQKIEYIHNNPVARGFVDEAIHWRWSSFRNYSGVNGLMDIVTDWR